MKQDNDINAFMTNMIIVFLLITSIVFTTTAIVYTINDVLVIKNITVTTAALHIIWLLFFLYYKKFYPNFQYEPIIIMYLAYILMALYPIVCIYWNSGYTVAFFWYMLVPIGAAAFKVRNILLWFIVTLLTTVSVFFISHFFPTLIFPPSLNYMMNIMTVVLVIAFTAFFTIMFIWKDKIEQYVQAERMSAVEHDLEDLEKSQILNNEIIEYFKKEKPFKNPDFDELVLAKALNSNINYISKAIKAGGNVNFKTLLNKFRIDHVKSMLDSGVMEKYTIDYIFSDAGYRHRTTFNTAFKSIVGTTPSNYVLLKNKDNNSAL